MLHDTPTKNSQSDDSDDEDPTEYEDATIVDKENPLCTDDEDDDEGVAFDDNPFYN